MIASQLHSLQVLFPCNHLNHLLQLVLYIDNILRSVSAIFTFL